MTSFRQYARRAWPFWVGDFLILFPGPGATLWLGRVALGALFPLAPDRWLHVSAWVLMVPLWWLMFRAKSPSRWLWAKWQQRNEIRQEP